MKFKFLKLVVVLLLFSSCGTIVNYDFEKSTDFSVYKTYNYFTDIETGLSQLDNKRLFRAIDAKLKSMGLVKSDTPSFYIDIKSEDAQNRTNNNVGVGFGGGGRNMGGGLSVGIPVGLNKATRIISIEFVDDTKSGMFWQAISESSYSVNAKPEKREANFIELVEKVFTKYPPEQ